MDNEDLLAFLDLESGFEKLVLPAWEKEAAKIAGKAARALARGSEEDAIAAVMDLSTEGIIRRAKGQAKHLAVSALLYGAKNVSGSVHGTVFKDEIPFGVDNALKAHFAMCGRVLEQHVIRDALDEIDTIVQELKNPTVGADQGQVKLRKADEDFVTRLNKAVDRGGRMMASISANLTTSRLISYGFLAQATAQEITYYRLQATLDRRTSDLCESLNGKEFPVASAYGFMRQVLQIQDPDELKVAAPWIKGNKATVAEIKSLPSEELMSKYGVMVPPFHPNCRTILVKGLTQVKVIEGPGLYSSPPSVVTEKVYTKEEKVKAYQDLMTFIGSTPYAGSKTGITDLKWTATKLQALQDSGVKLTEDQAAIISKVNAYSKAYGYKPVPASATPKPITDLTPQPTPYKDLPNPAPTPAPEANPVSTPSENMQALFASLAQASGVLPSEASMDAAKEYHAFYKQKSKQHGGNALTPDEKNFMIDYEEFMAEPENGGPTYSKELHEAVIEYLGYQPNALKIQKTIAIVVEDVEGEGIDYSSPHEVQVYRAFKAWEQANSAPKPAVLATPPASPKAAIGDPPEASSYTMTLAGKTLKKFFDAGEAGKLHDLAAQVLSNPYADPEVLAYAKQLTAALPAPKSGTGGTLVGYKVVKPTDAFAVGEIIPLEDYDNEVQWDSKLALRVEPVFAEAPKLVKHYVQGANTEISEITKEISAKYASGVPSFQLKDGTHVTLTTDAANAHVNKMWYAQQGANSKFTEKELGALRDYTGSYHADLNQGLRDGTSLSTHSQSIDSGLWSAFKKARLPESVVGFRGIRPDVVKHLLGMKDFSEESLDLVVGYPLEDKGYTSVSMSRARARAFGSVLLILKVPEGTVGVGVNPISQHEGEAEILLRKGSRFIIEGYKRLPNGDVELHVRLEQ